MAVVNATSQFAVVNNKLALSYSAMSRLASVVSAAPLGDGQVTNGNDRRLITDLRLHWKSPYTVPVRAVAWYGRQKSTVQTGGSNFMYIRERYTAAIGIDSTSQVLAPEPTTDPLFNTEFGGGGDSSMIRNSQPESFGIINHTMDQVGVGQSIDVRVRANLFCQEPWNGSATNNYVYTLYHFIYLFVYPENGV